MPLLLTAATVLNHVCAVGMRIDFGFVRTEVPTVDVVGISVAVVVDTIFAVKLGRVFIDIGGKVFVGVVDSTVDNRHQYIRFSRGSLPRIEEIYVGTLTTL